MSDNDLIDGYSIEEIRDYIAECLRNGLSSFVNQPMSEEVKQDMIRACQEVWAKTYAEHFGLLEYIYVDGECSLWQKKEEDK